MKATVLVRYALVAGVALLVGACASVAPRTSSVSADHEARVAKIERISSWSIRGRIAVSDGKESGSGRFDWTQDGQSYVMTIRAPVSNQTWRLSGDEDHARLEGVKPVPVEGEDPEQLLAREVGWHVPIAQMRNWVRGISLTQGAQIMFSDDGLPRDVREARWTVNYRDYDRALDPPMPTRIAANKPPYNVRLAISAWTLHE